MKKNNLKKIGIIALSSALWMACDKDFNTIGTNIVGEDNFDFNSYTTENVVAYNRKTGAVQTNNLPVNAFGIHEDPAFGTTRANFVSQVQLINPITTPEKNPVIDSVYLYVPYFSTLKSTDDKGNRTYTLDSITGGDTKMDLKVYENGYLLRDLDPNDGFLSAQRFYSNQTQPIENNRGAEVLNDKTLANEYSETGTQNTAFFFDKREIKIYKTNKLGEYVNDKGEKLADQSNTSLRVVKERFAPGMWLDLKNSFFQDKLFGLSADGNLANNNVFKQYFRGLYFKLGSLNGNQGALAMMNFAQGKITVKYKVDGDDDGKPETPLPRVSKTMVINLSGNTINLIETTPSTSYSNTLNGSNSVAGDEKLYVKGADGSVAFIKLFTPAELENLKASRWLINEAYLEFYVDQSKMNVSNQKIAERIYLYDATNNAPLIDYLIDSSINSANAKRNKFIHDGILERDATTKNAVKYKVRITNHINQLLNKNAQNVTLGLAVTESINISNAAYVNPFNANYSADLKFVPLGSVMHQFGTVLYGNNTTDTAKKLKLKIIYTKPN